MARLNCFTSLLIAALCVTQANAQSVVSAVHTDFDGYWFSQNGALNPSLPNDHNMLLAFTIGGTTYSTGVDDTTLDTEGVTYSAGNWNAITVPSLPNTPAPFYTIMLGAAVDGDNSGAGTFTAPADSLAVAAYLIDGTQGLDFGTGVANIPSGAFDFEVSSILSDAISDGTPDLLFTQMADFGDNDSIVFLDDADNIVGTKEPIAWSGVSRVGKWETDYFAMDGSNTATNLTKSMRLIAMDFSDLGINATNAADVAKIRVVWGGESDPAFLAYNTDSFFGCEEFTFSGVSIVAPASGAGVADGAVSPSITGGSEPYSLAFILQGDTVPASGWSALAPGKYWVRALDSNDCTSTNSVQVFLPHSKCQ